jgi:hypothetical protein
MVITYPHTLPGSLPRVPEVCENICLSVRFYSENCTVSAGPMKPSKRRSAMPSTTHLPPLLALTEYLCGGYIGPAYRGNIITAKGERLRVVAKIALGEEEKDALRHEAKVYSQIHKLNSVCRGGIPSLVGIYNDSDDKALVLITTDVGKALHRCDSINSK